jgi:hypothetical protein
MNDFKSSSAFSLLDDGFINVSLHYMVTFVTSELFNFREAQSSICGPGTGNPSPAVFKFCKSQSIGNRCCVSANNLLASNDLLS